MLPRSVCSRSLLEALQPLFDAGFVHWEKAAGGQRLAVANLPGLDRWFCQNFPETQTGAGITSSRIQAVAQFRDSKALPSNLPEIVCLRAGVIFLSAPWTDRWQLNFPREILLLSHHE